jgi:RHS repeat-associated protein
MANNPIAECETRNNVAFSHLFEYELFDGNGYAARHTTLVAVNQNDLSPRFETTAPVDALVGAIYRYQPLVTTQAVGSGLRFELRNGPDGMAINALTGEIRWTPSAAQLGSHTLQIYVFDINGRFATQSITITVAADGSNRPPLITSKGPRDARPGSFYVYDLEAHDPDLDVLSYRFTGATPPGMQIDAATGRVTWSVPASQFGGAAFTVEVTDGRGGVATQFTSMGIYPTVLNMAPYFTSAPPTEAREGEPYAYAPTTGDPDGDPVVVTVASAPPGAVLGGDGVLRWTPAVDQLGRQLIRLTATDDDGATALQDAWIDVTSSSGPLTVAISGLDDDVNEITRPEAISGVVSGEDIREWRLAVRPSNSPDAVPEFIATGTSGFNGGTIGTFDPTLRMNGMYTVILQAWRNDGQTASDSRVLRVTGDMKVGHFSMAFEDVSVNVAGLPVRVTRTYDTRQRAEPLDFGFGWSVDYQNVRLRESRKMGFSWYTVPQQLSTCVRANGDPTVTVTLPDGEVHSFRARAVPECVIGGQAFVSLGFTPTDGTDSTLEQTSYGLLRIVDVVGTQVKNLVDIDDLTTPVDPRFYRLTTPEGVVYEIDQNFGVRRVIEPNGQSLTYTAEAITHSTGVEIDIVRDSEGRISDLVLPDGEVLSYTYTAAGDLESFTDELDRVTTFGYTSVAHPHYLTEIVDPRGVRVARNEYDDEGRLVRTIDADGNVIAFEHALGTQTETVRDRNGNATLYVYDDEGRVLTETNALNETITRTYDADGNVLTETNALGQTTTSTYDPRGNRLTETNALGETTRSTYDARNNLLTQTDGSGTVVMRNTYAAVRSNNLTRTEDALGNATQFVYDGDTGEMLRMTDALNRETRYELDPRGWRVGETDPLGVETRYSYDFQGRVRTETRTRVVNGATQSLVTRYTYDAAGNLTRTEHPDGSVTTTEYNAIDKPSRECDALTRCTEHTYDARGNPLRTTYPDGTYEETSYDANGNTIAQRDRGGRTTRMTYDAANRLVETIHPDAVPASGDDGNPANNPRTRNEYDRAGRLLASVDPNGRRTEYRYDAAGRRTQVIEPAVDGSSATTVTTYDATGRRTAVTDALGRTARFVYDAAGRMTTTIHPDAGPDDGNDANNPRTVVDYDALGRKTVETDPDGRRTEYGYDPLGRLTSVVLAAGTPSATTTTYAYDEQGNRITQTDAEGRATRFTFDRIGRETSRTLPLGQVETKTWTAAGEPATLTDFNGRTTAWTHDTVGRVSTIDYPNDADVQFTYTDSGQRATVVDGHGTVTHVQDARDRLVRRTDAAGRVIEYTYDEAGNLTSRVTASQSLVYTYDARNRLTSVTQTVAGGTPRTTTYTYDAVGNRASMTGGDGTTTQYTYDRRNRLTQLVQRSAAAAVLFAASYTVDATGLRTGAQESDAGGVVRTLSWTYDALKRLTGESIDHRDDTRDRTSAWTYDRVGNRLTQVQTLGAGALAQTTTTTSTYDANDRLLTETVQTGSGPAQVTTTTYDAQGNTLTRSGPDGLVEYTWNDANRLVEQRTASGRTTYRYDADGLRIGQMHFPSTGTPTRTDYLVDPSFAYANVIERFEGAAGVGAAAPKLAQVYAFGEGIVGQTTCTPNAGSGVHDCPAAQERFVHADGFGSTRLVTDVSGVVTDRVDYDAWGNEIAREGTTAVEHLYRGEQFDPNLGWYYLRARYYLQSTGRFASMDSFEGFSTSPGSLHKYLYAHANPIMGRDPSGYLLVEEGLANTIMAKLAVSAVALAVTATTAGVLSLGPGPHINSPGARKNYSSALEANIAEQCARQQRGPDDCVSRMPTLFLGRDVSLHTMHVRAALDESSASPLLNYRNEQHPRRWLQYTAECKGRTGLGTGLDCDEYPYAASVQGGQANHRFGAVYLRPVLSADNQLAGNRLFHKLLSPCRIQQRGGSSPSPQFDGVSMFAVVPVLSQATTTGRCSDGTTIR